MKHLLTTVFLTLMFSEVSAQQMSVFLGMNKIKDVQGNVQDYSVASISLSFDNLSFDKEGGKFRGFQLTVFPGMTIYQDNNNQQDGDYKITKALGSFYFGKLFKASKVFYFSLSGGAALGYSNIREWDNKVGEYITVNQFSAGAKASESIHIRIKRGGIVAGFEQLFMLNSMSVSFFKIGYSFGI